ncbi:MAG: gamma-glutamylcyclotransferase [Opitutae bacterium]|jgi:gamma-glutamylcyclotransferase (GGCT)/AIG2-like uncharacterized protein YtfP|nr:gamma-glutamylcyclotransferase [Opitutae bacterium]MBT5717608.1 gamma-glutamylcyclotransferase [Opitutae bacterium]
MESLFSYGTLQLEEVQKALFGRILMGMKDQLPGYQVENLKIMDPHVIEKSGTDIHPILVFTGDSTDFVSGTVFEIDEEELKTADEYEVEEYERVSAKMSSGNEAWIYRALTKLNRRCS